MRKSIMNGETLWNAIAGNRIHERRLAGGGSAAKRALMTAAAIVGLVLLVGAMASTACAQSYPNKPIHLIAPFATGGATDVMARLIGDELSKQLGQPVLIENRPGAGGNIGTAYVAKSRPDGYNLCLGTTVLSISPSIYKKLTYDPGNDLAVVAMVADWPFTVMVRLDHPANNLKEFVEYAKAKPGKLNWGHGGTATCPHLGGELLNILAGKNNMVAAAYKSTPAAVTAMLGGEVEMVIGGATAAFPHIQKGSEKIKVIATSGRERMEVLPDVPTGKEVGINEFVLYNWANLLAPAGTPNDVLNRLNAAWVKIAATPQVKKKMDDIGGFRTITSTPEEGLAFVRSEIDRFTKIVKAAKIPAFD
jgi:tripartite-type tricarboxylate transporter receptor subunit TctC